MEINIKSMSLFFSYLQIGFLVTFSVTTFKRYCYWYLWNIIGSQVHCYKNKTICVWVFRTLNEFSLQNYTIYYFTCSTLSEGDRALIRELVKWILKCIFPSLFRNLTSFHSKDHIQTDEKTAAFIIHNISFFCAQMRSIENERNRNYATITGTFWIKIF